MSHKRSVRWKRKNRKIKFSEDRYVEKYYMKDGRGVIPVKLTKISDLYMPHDYKQMELSDDVCNYIEEIAYMIPVNVDIIIEIHCPEIDDETKERIRKSIHNNYGLEIDDVEYEMELGNRRSLILLIFGVILLTINILTDNYIGEVLSNFISVVWWVAIWDLIEIQLLDKTEDKFKRLNYLQLYDAAVVFVFDQDVM